MSLKINKLWVVNLVDCSCGRHNSLTDTRETLPREKCTANQKIRCHLDHTEVVRSDVQAIPTDLKF